MIGKNVRKIRKEKGISILDLSKKTNLSKSTISDLETGKSSPTIDTLMKIADALGVDVQDFFRESCKKASEIVEDLEEEFPEGVYVLRRASKELSPEAKKQMIKIMKAFLEEDD